MENAKELFLQAIGAILFCLAITILFSQTKEYINMTNAIKEAYQDSDAMNRNQYVDSELFTSYNEIIASLFSGLEYDLEINGLLISKYEHTADQIESYHIQNTMYKKRYFYDSNGTVTRIIYTSITPV